MDPEDFDQEDMEDDHFKNLTIADIEEMIKENNNSCPLLDTTVDQDTPAILMKDCSVNDKLESSKLFNLTDEDALLLDRNSDLDLDDELQNMDFESEVPDDINIIPPPKAIETTEEVAEETSPEEDLINKFKTQSLEQVSERSEESDQSSVISYNSADFTSDGNPTEDGADQPFKIKSIEDPILTTTGEAYVSPRKRKMTLSNELDMLKTI